MRTDAKARRVQRPLAIALLVAWWLACWFATGAWFDGEASAAYRVASVNAERFVADAVPGFKRMLRTHGGVPRMLARDPDIRRALARFGAAPPPPPADEEERRRRWSADPDLAQTSKFLEVSARELGFDALVLLNADGDCVAASNAGSASSIVGASYGNRDDFLRARAGHSGYLASAGKRMGSTGVSFYAPVIDQGRFIGVVTGGNALAPFVNLIDQADAFLSDRNGVVLLAQDASLMLHALPGAPVSRLDSAARQALYLRTELAPLDYLPWGDQRFPDLLRVPGRVAPVLLRSGSVEDGGLSVSVLWPMPQLLVLTQQRLLYAGLLGIVLLLLVAGYASRRREQRSMALALAEREQRVTDSRNFLDQIVNAVADPIFVKDREHRWVLVNQAFCELLGQARENFIGKSGLDVLVQREARISRDTDEQVLTAGIESIAEEKLTDSQGVTHIVVIKKVPCTDSAGQRFIVGIISDISERKQVERLLRAQERDFRTLAENAPDNIIRYDREGRIVYLNQEMETTLDVEAADLIGRRHGELYPDRRFEAYAQMLERVLASGEEGGMEMVLPGDADGAWIHHVRMVAERGENGEVSGVLAIGRDITERRRMNEALALREQEYRSLAENLPDNIARWDVAGRYFYVNSVLERFLATPAADLIGKTIAEAFPDARFAAFEAVIAQVLASGQAVQILRQPMPAGNGGMRIHDVSLLPERNGDGNVVSVLGVGRDMTELYRLQDDMAAREREFRILVETSPDPIVRFDRDCRRIYCSPAHADAVGVPNADLLGKTVAEYSPFPADVARAHAALIQQVIDHGEAGEMELNWERRGAPACIHVRASPEFDGEGWVTGVLTVGRDISALKQTEARLRKSRDVVRSLAAHQETVHEKERQALAYQIHEDLAQNLAALRMYISLLEMSAVSTPPAPLLKTVLDIVDRSIVRIRDMVSMLRPTVLDAGLVPALQWLTDDFTGVGFQFDLALQEDILLSDEVSTFLFRVAQEALLNIALHAGATHVHVSLDGVDGGCRLLVRDNGCGFDPGAPSAKDSFGLIRLTEQARHLGGDLFIDSAPGQGATLAIQLPG